VAADWGAPSRYLRKGPEDTASLAAGPPAALILAERERMGDLALDEFLTGVFRLAAVRTGFKSSILLQSHKPVGEFICFVQSHSGSGGRHHERSKLERSRRLLIMRATMQGISPLAITLYSMVCSTAVLAAASLFTGNWQPPLTPVGWFAAVGLGFCPCL
jgi:hypothetical protein